MTPFEARASFAVYPFVDGSRRILGSNYGFADPPVDFPRYAALHLDGPPAGRAAHRPADRARRDRGRLRPAAGRRRAAPGRRVRLIRRSAAGGRGRRGGGSGRGCRRARCAAARRPGSAGAGRGRDRRAAGGSSRRRRPRRGRALTAATMAALSDLVRHVLRRGQVLERGAGTELGAELGRRHAERLGGGGQAVLDDAERPARPAWRTSRPASSRAAVAGRRLDPGLEPVAAALVSLPVGDRRVDRSRSRPPSRPGPGRIRRRRGSPRTRAGRRRSTRRVAAAGGGRGGRDGRGGRCAATRGEVDAATEPMTVPPTRAATTRSAANPATRSLDIVV